MRVRGSTKLAMLLACASLLVGCGRFGFGFESADAQISAIDAGAVDGGEDPGIDAPLDDGSLALDAPMDGASIDAPLDAPLDDAPPGDAPLVDAALDVGDASCGAGSVDFATDPTACGACGNVCPSGAGCFGGVCGPSIGSGGAHTCIVSAGQVWCWGLNNYGQLGRAPDPNDFTSSTARPVPSITDAEAVVAGEEHTCVLRTTGAVVCFGRNHVGQLGDGAVANRAMATVPVMGLTDAVAIAEGFHHTCAVRAAGTLVCWGLNSSSQLGAGVSGDQRAPVPVVGLPEVVVSASGGATHTCAVGRTGTIYCWGANDAGQLGDGTTTPRGAPVAVMGVAEAVQVTAGQGGTCALRRNGAIQCWGRNYSGELGNSGAPGQVSLPVEVTGFGAGGMQGAAVSHGQYRACLLERAGGVRCWGLGGSSLNGLPSPNQHTPVVVPNTAGSRAIGANSSGACAARTPTDVACWGIDDYGQHGDGAAAVALSPVTVSGLSGVTGIGAGGGFAFSLSPTRAYAWGANIQRTLGNGNDFDLDAHPLPGLVATPPPNMLAIEGANYHSCGVGSDNTAYCWGSNLGLGIRGDGNMGGFIARPLPVMGLAAGTVHTIASADGASCAVDMAGDLYCWGANGWGQLGDGTGVQRNVATRVTALSNVRTVSLGFDHACAITGAGQLWCWGRNQYGQLGIGSVDASPHVSPIMVAGVTDATDVALGDHTTCVLRSDSFVYCFGRNENGQLGLGYATSNVPNLSGALFGAPTYVEVSMGAVGGCALRARPGAVDCWGGGWVGQIGDGTRQTRLRATQVSGLSDAVAIGVSSYSACAARAGGTVVCWGHGSDGQIGDGRTSYTAGAVSVLLVP